MDTAELIATLRSRVYDSSADVLDVLYSSPELIIPLFNSEAALATIGTSISSLGTSNSARTTLRSHLVFFCGPFVSAHPELSGAVLRTLVLPYALFTKPRGRTVASVWATVGSTALGSCALLHGTMEVVQKMEGSLDHGKMEIANVELAQQLAGKGIVSVVINNLSNSGCSEHQIVGRI